MKPPWPISWRNIVMQGLLHVRNTVFSNKGWTVIEVRYANCKLQIPPISEWYGFNDEFSLWTKTIPKTKNLLSIIGEVQNNLNFRLLFTNLRFFFGIFLVIICFDVFWQTLFQFGKFWQTPAHFGNFSIHFCSLPRVIFFFKLNSKCEETTFDILIELIFNWIWLKGSTPTQRLVVRQLWTFGQLNESLDTLRKSPVSCYIQSNTWYPIVISLRLSELSSSWPSSDPNVQINQPSRLCVNINF